MHPAADVTAANGGNKRKMMPVRPWLVFAELQQHSGAIYGELPPQIISSAARFSFLKRLNQIH